MSFPHAGQLATQTASSAITSLAVTTLAVGDLVQLSVAGGGNKPTITSVASSRITWRASADRADPGPTGKPGVTIWSGTVTSVGTDTVMIGWSTTTDYCDLSVDEYTGLGSATVWTLVGANSANSTTTGTVNTGSVTAGAGDLAVGATWVETDLTIGSTGWSGEATADGNTLAWNQSTSSGAVALTGTMASGGTTWIAAMAVYSASASAAPGGWIVGPTAWGAP